MVECVSKCSRVRIFITRIISTEYLKTKSEQQQSQILVIKLLFVVVVIVVVITVQIFKFTHL